MKAAAKCYSIQSERVKIIDLELVAIQREGKEATDIRQQRPSMNSEWGYKLSPHI